MYCRITHGNCIICLQNCFDLPLEKNVLVVKKKHLKFEAVGKVMYISGCRPKIYKKIEITRIVYSDSDKSEQFLKQNTF